MYTQGGEAIVSERDAEGANKIVTGAQNVDFKLYDMKYVRYTMYI